MYMYKRGIALLITLLFIIAITVSVGVGLSYVNKASNELKNSNFMFQTSIIIDDVIEILKESKELSSVIEDGSADSLNIFLSQSSFIPFESSGLKMTLQISSARSKFNPNGLLDSNGSSVNLPKVEAMKLYLRNKMVDVGYVDILLDSMSGIKEDFTYNTDMFNDKPYLFRDYIVSKQHLEELNRFYEQTYRNNSLSNIDFEKLFYFNSDRDIPIDLNYATSDVWEFILGTSRDRAKQLTLGGGTYTGLDSISLSDDEKASLARFNVSYFEPYLDVKISIVGNKQSSNIRFEYDINNKKGSNFSYDI